MTTIEKLDLVLTFIATEPPRALLDIGNSFSERYIHEKLIERNPNLKQQLPEYLDDILSWLESDGYIKSTTNTLYGTISVSITPKGEDFLSSGGYTKFKETQETLRTLQLGSMASQIEMVKSQSEMVRLVEIQTKLNKRLTSLTKWIALGSIVAAAYYLKELGAWAHHGFCWCY